MPRVPTGPTTPRPGRGRGKTSPSTNRRHNPYPQTPPGTRMSARLQAAAGPSVSLNPAREEGITSDNEPNRVYSTEDDSDSESSSEDEIVDVTELVLARRRQEEREREEEATRQQLLRERMEEEEHWRRMHLEYGAEYADILPPVAGMPARSEQVAQEDYRPLGPTVGSFVAHSHYNAVTSEEGGSDDESGSAEDAEGEEDAEAEEHDSDSKMNLADVVQEILQSQEGYAQGSDDEQITWARGDDMATPPRGPTDAELRLLYDHEITLMPVIIGPTPTFQEVVALKESTNCCDVNSIFASDPGYKRHRFDDFVASCITKPKPFRALFKLLTGRDCLDSEPEDEDNGSAGEVEAEITASQRESAPESENEADDEADDDDSGDEDYVAPTQTKASTTTRRRRVLKRRNTAPKVNDENQDPSTAQQAEGDNYDEPIRQTVIDGFVQCPVDSCPEAQFPTATCNISDITAHLKKFHPQALPGTTEDLQSLPCSWPGCTRLTNRAKVLHDEARTLARHWVSHHMEHVKFACPRCGHTTNRYDASSRHISTCKGGPSRVNRKRKRTTDEE